MLRSSENDLKIRTMLKRIYSYLLILSASALFVVACKDDDGDEIVKFTSNVNVAASSEVADKYAMTLEFSTDDGATWVKYPIVKVGQTYLARVFNQTTGSELANSTCFNVDWSASNPQPTEAPASQVAKFIMKSTSAINATVTNVPFVANDVAGKYEVVTDDWEDFFPGDVLTLEAIDATHVRIVEYPGTSTNHKPLVITVPDPTMGGVSVVSSQNNGAYGSTQLTTSGSGTIDCHGDIELHLDFVYGSTSYAGNVLELKKK
jgi:hypothetical protein